MKVLICALMASLTGLVPASRAAAQVRAPIAVTNGLPADAPREVPTIAAIPTPSSSTLVSSTLPENSGSVIRVAGTLFGAVVGGFGGVGLAYATHWHFYPARCGDCNTPSVGAWPVVGGAVGAGLGGAAMWWLVGRFTDAPREPAH